MCPITRKLIRDPVPDPTNPKILCEKRALYAWYCQQGHRSPTTNQEFSHEQFMIASFQGR